MGINTLEYLIVLYQVDTLVNSSTPNNNTNDAILSSVHALSDKYNLISNISTVCMSNVFWRHSHLYQNGDDDDDDDDDDDNDSDNDE